MEQIEFEAVAITLIEELRERDSWSSVTHLQKAMFFLQDMMQVPLGHDFVLYKHGPYSFDLQPAINAMLADRILSYEIKDPAYGASLVKGDNWEVVTRKTQDVINLFRPRIAYVAEKLAAKNVAQLERVATAFLVYKRHGLGENEDAIAQRINELKPHVSIDEAKEAFREAKQISAAAQSLLI